MKKDLHPEMHKIKITCASCGTEFETQSTSKDVKVDVCSSCHPFYTGKLTSNSKTGRVERFKKLINQK